MTLVAIAFLFTLSSSTFAGDAPELPVLNHTQERWTRANWQAFNGETALTIGTNAASKEVLTLFSVDAHGTFRRLHQQVLAGYHPPYFMDHLFMAGRPESPHESRTYAAVKYDDPETGLRIQLLELIDFRDPDNLVYRQLDLPQYEGWRLRAVAGERVLISTWENSVDRLHVVEVPDDGPAIEHASCEFPLDSRADRAEYTFSDGRVAFANADTVIVLDAETLQQTHVLSLPLEDDYIGVQSLAIVGNVLYACSFIPNQFWVIDLTVPGSPVILSTMDLPRSGFLRVDGDRLYVQRSNSVAVLDIRHPDDPVLLTPETVNLPNSTRLPSLHGNLALSSTHQGLELTDLSDPNNPMPVASYLESLWNDPVVVVGDHAYLATRDSLFHAEIINRDELHNLAPVDLGPLTRFGQAWGMGKRLLVQYADGDDISRLRLFDIGDPESPTLLADMSSDPETSLIAREMVTSASMAACLDIHYEHIEGRWPVSTIRQDTVHVMTVEPEGTVNRRQWGGGAIERLRLHNGILYFVSGRGERRETRVGTLYAWDLNDPTSSPQAIVDDVYDASYLVTARYLLVTEYDRDLDEYARVLQVVYDHANPLSPRPLREFNSNAGELGYRNALFRDSAPGEHLLSPFLRPLHAGSGMLVIQDYHEVEFLEAGAFPLYDAFRVYEPNRAILGVTFYEDAIFVTHLDRITVLDATDLLGVPEPTELQLLETDRADQTYWYFVYPNPTNATATFVIHVAERDALDLRVINILGQEVLHLQPNVLPGFQEISIDVRHLASGKYHMLVRNGGDHEGYYRTFTVVK